MRVRMMVVVAGAVLAAACSDVNAPTGLDGLGPLAEIVDGRDVGVGNQHFFWLPPIALGRRPGGLNLTGLAPDVKIFECTAEGVDPCSSLGNSVAEFTALTARGSKTARGRGNHYRVKWHTVRGSSDQVVPGRTYRICVSVGTLNLGHADVFVGSNGKVVKDARAHDNVPLVDGSTLPIKFRIEGGYDEPGVGSDDGCPGGGPTLATLSGTMTIDLGFGPPVGAGGRDVTLFDELGTQLGSVTTPGSGFYSFVDLTPGGTYTVCALAITGLVLPGGTASICLDNGLVGFTRILESDPTTQDFAFVKP